MQSITLFVSKDLLKKVADIMHISREANAVRLNTYQARKICGFETPNTLPARFQNLLRTELKVYIEETHVSIKYWSLPDLYDPDDWDQYISSSVRKFYESCFGCTPQSTIPIKCLFRASWAWKMLVERTEMPYDVVMLCIEYMPSDCQPSLN